MAIDNNGTAEFNNVTVRGTVDGSEIKGGSININDNFTVDEKGVLTAKNGEFQGTAKATDGSFINCSINNCMIGENINFYGNIHSEPLYLTKETHLVVLRYILLQVIWKIYILMFKIH